MGMGFLARNSTRHVLASYCATKLYIVDPGIAKAILAWKMIEVDVSFGFQSVICYTSKIRIKYQKPKKTSKINIQEYISSVATELMTRSAYSVHNSQKLIND